jgi:hypothetical protein
MHDAPAQNEPKLPDSKPSAWREVVDNPWVVLALLFLVMGFLGLPILWASRGFSRRAKVWLSLVVIVYTLALIGCTGAVLWWSYQSISKSFAPFRT